MQFRQGRQGLIALRWLFATFLLLISLGYSALAGESLKGVALVIGQSEYKSLTALPNPVNDARAIENLLARLGFETDLATDENAKKLRRTIDGFVDDAEGADVALLYYSGHGIEAGGINYLLPVDASIDSLADGDKALISLQDVLAQLRTKARVTILLLDACRSNPFPKDAVLKRGGDPGGQPVAASGLGAPRGAVAMEDTAASSDTIGEVIGFAAEPGHSALDGVADGNSPYAAALLKHLAANAGYDFGQVMTLVTEEVYLDTGTRQRPWTNASLRRFLSFGGTVDEASADEALLTGERRKLLLSIAATPQDTRNAVEGLARDQSLPLDPLYGILKELQVDTAAGPDQLEKQLRLGAENLKKLLAEKVVPLRKDPELIRLAGLADRAQAEGAIALAKDYRAKASARADELDKTLDQREADILADRIELASTYAEEAETSILAFDFELAAAKFAKAYEQVEGRDGDLAFKYKLSQANAFANYGIYKGKNDAIARSFPLYEEAISSADRDKNRDNWATAQNDLGRAYRLLGERDAGSQFLQKAIEAFDAALTVSTRDHAPTDWAMIQNNLGNVLWTLGEREEGSEKLLQAISAYEASLTVLTREQKPLDWARVQNNLGNVRYKLGERGEGTASLYVAVAGYRDVLKIWTRERVPSDWAMVQNNLGVALKLLGERERDPALLHASVDALEAALLERHRERVPLDWAATQNNLGNTLAALGKPKGDKDFLARAVAAYELALQETTREREPLQWARIQSNLGMTRLPLGILTQDRAVVESGRRSVELAWAVYRQAGYAQYDAFFRERLKLFDEFLPKAQ